MTEPGMKPKKLTVKEERFALNYLIDGNGAKAARDAGYSEHSDDSIASENLRKPHIKTFILQKQREMARKQEVTAESVVAELAKIAFSNMGDYLIVAPDGSHTLDLSALDRDSMAAMSEVTQTSTGEGAEAKHTVKFKLHSKIQALELLGKYLALFVTKVEHTGKDGGPLPTSEMSYLEIARRVAFVVSRGNRELQGIDQPVIEQAKEDG